jgi:hypothetical protein
VKNPIGFSMLYFSAFSLLHNSYRQVLTTHLQFAAPLRLPIRNKFILVTFHLQATQRNYKTGLHQFRGNESSPDLDLLLAIINKLFVAM